MVTIPIRKKEGYINLEKKTCTMYVPALGEEIYAIKKIKTNLNNEVTLKQQFGMPF